jgi:uroporphyrinogen III methyltransferase/synthase
LPIYKTEVDYEKAEALNLCADEMDYIIFSSGSAVKAFAKMREKETRAKTVSIGHSTASAAEKVNIRIDITAKSASARGIMQAIADDLKTEELQ